MLKRRTPEQVAAALWARVDELGGTRTDESVYVNSGTSVVVYCAAMHRCTPLPRNVLWNQQGLCEICGGKDRAAAEDRCWAPVAELGSTRAPGPGYHNRRTGVAVLCTEGHLCFPTPASLARGRGLCSSCAGNGPLVAEEGFWARVDAHGATPAPAGAVYVNAHTPVPLICAEGHDCSPMPSSLQQDQGPCEICAGRHKPTSAAEFWVIVDRLGARAAAGAAYINALTPVPLICPEGTTAHRGRPRRAPATGSAASAWSPSTGCTCSSTHRRPGRRWPASAHRLVPRTAGRMSRRRRMGS